MVRLTLKVFHDVEEFIVDIWTFLELYFDLVEIGQCILDIKWAISCCSLSTCQSHHRHYTRRRRRRTHSSRRDSGLRHRRQ